MTAAMEVLLELEESVKHLTPRNHYTEVVDNCFDVIHRLLLKGLSRNYIFRTLQDSGIFNDNAEISNFYKAVTQAYQRKDMKIPKLSGYVHHKRKQEEIH